MEDVIIGVNYQIVWIKFKTQEENEGYTWNLESEVGYTK
jgi:hypothetical protein